jgi:hypothetical protein
MQLKEEEELPWAMIARSFLEKSQGTLQVHYSNNLEHC